MSDEGPLGLAAHPHYPHFATCRVCGREFTPNGWGAQSEEEPRRCLDCQARHLAYHTGPLRACTCERDARLRERITAKEERP